MTLVHEVALATDLDEMQQDEMGLTFRHGSTLLGNGGRRPPIVKIHRTLNIKILIDGELALYGRSPLTGGASLGNIYSTTVVLTYG